MKNAILLATLFTLGACATVPDATLPMASSYVYHVGPSDVIKVGVYREPQLSGEYTVSGKGEITLPLVGAIPVGGSTLDDTRRKIAATLDAKVTTNAQVSVETIKFRPVYVLGEVEKPGEYVYRERMTLPALIAAAGGFHFRANKKMAYVRHDGENAEIPYKLTSGATLLPGDVVRIGNSIF